jgi:hypothetical protein
VIATASKQTSDWPLWWFAQLEAALKRGDRGAAAAAIRRLEQLGYEVRFTLPPNAQEGVRA